MAEPDSVCVEEFMRRPDSVSACVWGEERTGQFLEWIEKDSRRGKF